MAVRVEVLQNSVGLTYFAILLNNALRGRVESRNINTRIAQPLKHSSNISIQIPYWDCPPLLEKHPRYRPPNAPYLQVGD